MEDQRHELEEALLVELLDDHLLGRRQKRPLSGETGAYSVLSPQQQAQAATLQTILQTPYQDSWSVNDRIQELHRRLNLTPVGLRESSEQRSLRDLSSSGSHLVDEQAKIGKLQRFSKPIVNWLVATAVAGLLMVAGIKMAFTPPADIDTSNSAAESFYTTANGQRATVTLMDGTTITLNVGSQLSVPTNYGVTTRELRLSGEAHFSVRHSEGIPLIVTAGPGRVKVLGTQFVVRHYSTDTAALVAVKEGKVGVKSTVLTANQEVFVGGDNVSDVRPGNISRFSFARGQLVLTEGTLQEAIPELNRWYNVDIYLGESTLGSQQLAWKSPEGSISDLVSILELAMPVRVVREGRTLTIYPK